MCLEDGHMDNLLLLMRHVNIDNVLSVDVRCALLLNHLRHVHDFLLLLRRRETVRFLYFQPLGTDSRNPAVGVLG